MEIGNCSGNGLDSGGDGAACMAEEGGREGGRGSRGQAGGTVVYVALSRGLPTIPPLCSWIGRITPHRFAIPGRHAIPMRSTSPMNLRLVIWLPFPRPSFAAMGVCSSGT